MPRTFFKDSSGNIIPVPSTPESEEQAYAAGWTDASEEEADDYIIQESRDAQKAVGPTFEELSTPTYDKANYDLYKEQGLSHEQAVAKAQDAYKRNEANRTYLSADPAFADASDWQSAVGTFVESALDSATLNISKFVEGGIGQALDAIGFHNNAFTPEAIAMRERANPTLKTAGDITGIVGPGVLSIAKNVFPRLAENAAVRIGTAAIESPTLGGKVAENLTYKMVVDPRTKTIIRNETEQLIKKQADELVAEGMAYENAELVARASPQIKTTEDLLKNEAVLRKLQEVGANGDVIARMKTAGQLAFAGASQAAIQGGISGIFREGQQLQRGAIAEGGAVGYIGDLLEGGAKGAGEGALVGGAATLLVPQGLKGLTWAITKVNNALQTAAREMPVVSVPALGSVLGQTSKSELREAMLRQAESKTPQFVKNIGRVAEAIEDEIAAHGDAELRLTEDYRQLLDYAFPDLTAQSKAPMLQAFQNAARQNREALINSPYMKSVTRGGVTTHKIDRDALAEWIARQPVGPDTREIPLPPEITAWRGGVQAQLEFAERLQRDAFKQQGGGLLPSTPNVPEDARGFFAIPPQADSTMLGEIGERYRTPLGEGIGARALSEPAVGTFGGTNRIPPSPFAFRTPYDYLPPEQAAAQFAKTNMYESALAGINPPPAGVPVPQPDFLSRNAPIVVPTAITTTAKVLGVGLGKATGGGLAAAYVGGSLVNPKKVIETLGSIDNATQRFHMISKGFANRLLGSPEGRAAGSAITKGVTQLPSGQIDVLGHKVGFEKKERPEFYNYKDNLNVWNKETRSLEELTPEQLGQRLSQLNGPMADFSTEMANQAAFTTMAAVTLLKEKQAAIMSTNRHNSPDWTPSPQMAQQYAKYSFYVRNPLQVLPDTINKKFIPPEGMEVLQKVYPELLLEIRSDLVDKFASMVEKGEKINPQDKLLMDKFLGDEYTQSLDKGQIAKNAAAMQVEKRAATKRVLKSSQLEGSGLAPRAK